jgi:hypothetical protein
MTAIDKTLSEEVQQDLLRRCWLWHDARWYASVAAEFGLDVADRLNRANVLALGATEMRRVMKALGVDRVDNLSDALELYEIARRLYVPAHMEADVSAVTETSYDVVFGAATCTKTSSGRNRGVQVRRVRSHPGGTMRGPAATRNCRYGRAMAAGLECRERFALRGSPSCRACVCPRARAAGSS